MRVSVSVNVSMDDRALTLPRFLKILRHELPGINLAQIALTPSLPTQYTHNDSIASTRESYSNCAFGSSHPEARPIEDPIF